MSIRIMVLAWSYVCFSKVMMGPDFKHWVTVCWLGFSYDSVVFMFTMMMRPLRPRIELEVYGLRRSSSNDSARDHEELHTAALKR